MHARWSGRAFRRGAEGATAPETLRQKDRGRKGALESSGRSQAPPLTEGVSLGHGSPAAGVNLSGSTTEGAGLDAAASALSEVRR